jgi:hypothetical protein
MPVVETFNITENFTFRIIKYHALNPDRKWASTYEFNAIGTGSEDELLALGVALVSFEAAFHRDTILFDRLLISTWAPDSKPYNPSTFISSGLSAVGLVGAVGENAALNQTLSVARIAASGRQGHIFYRGVLNEAEISAPAGKSILTSRASYQTAIDNALTTSGLDDYVGPSARLSLKLVMINSSGTQVRPVNTLFVKGVTTLPMDHAWFNRTTTPTP